MKKIQKYEKHLLSVIRKKNQYLLRKSTREKKKRFKKARTKRIYAPYFRIKGFRDDFYKKFYFQRFNAKPLTFKIDNELGIEEDKNIEYFLDISEQIIEFNAKTLKLDLSDCTYVWPSGITMLCSLVEWVELAAIGHSPSIMSSAPRDQRVNSYLAHSGFYDYVVRIKDVDDTNYYKSSEIVKIQREQDYSKIEYREDEIKELLKRYSCFNSDEIELFVDKVLIEIFNNVTEHGIAHKDKGYWLIAQYHSTHRFISLCIGDNGIGIRNSLMTGPQHLAVARKLENIALNDGEFIKLTFEEVFSGALKAHILANQNVFSQKLESGANRGNGMKRIRAACRKLSIPFSILSQHGYLFFDEKGKIKKCGAKRRKIFAGTLFNLIIKTKEVNDE